MSSLSPRLSTNQELQKYYAAGRFVRKKGFEFLLKAILEVLAGDCRTQFQIVEDEPEFDELKLEDKVQFLGFRNDGPLLMKRSDFFVMSSLSKAFVNIMLEAMVTGTPIVTTRNDGALHLLNGDTAIFL